jgi:hypothetical protein
MDRRAFLRTTALASAASFARLPKVWAASTADNRWRGFEVTTRVEILSPSGVTRAWIPLPLVEETDYHKSLGAAGAATRPARTPFVTRATAPTSWSPSGRLARRRSWSVSRIATRDRQVDLERTGRRARGEPGGPPPLPRAHELIRTDGIVEATAREITKTAGTDVEKARALYEWIVENTFRDAKVRGCGLGDIKTMLETKNSAASART